MFKSVDRRFEYQSLSGNTPISMTGNSLHRTMKSIKRPSASGRAYLQSWMWGSDRKELTLMI
jgi:hypothetical protein